MGVSTALDANGRAGGVKICSRQAALVSLLDPLRPQEEPIWSVYPQRRHLLPKARLLIDKLREELPARSFIKPRDPGLDPGSRC